MSPPLTLILASPVLRPVVSVVIASARTGPAASVYPAAAAAEAVMKNPRRDSGSTWRAKPSTSGISLGRADMRHLPYWPLEKPLLRRPDVSLKTLGERHYSERGSSLAMAVTTRASIGSISVANTAAIW